MPLIMYDTVATDTPASFATSLIVSFDILFTVFLRRSLHTARPDIDCRGGAIRKVYVCRE